MTAREEILGRVRKALGRREGDATGDPAPPILHTTGNSAEERVAQFRAAFEALAGKVHLAATPAEAGAAIRTIIGSRTCAASRAAIVTACGIEAAEFSRETCATVDVGITSADYALADTGSLVIFTESAESRLLSLLPPCHIVVLEQSRLVENLDELLLKHPQPASGSSGMIIATGPSRTADIEMLLVRGVHGPGEIHAVLIAM